MRKASLKINKTKEKELIKAVETIEDFIKDIAPLWKFDFDKESVLKHSPILKRIIENIVEPMWK